MKFDLFLFIRHKNILLQKALFHFHDSPYFLCLETKKVSKENSRQTRSLRAFCLASATYLYLIDLATPRHLDTMTTQNPQPTTAILPYLCGLKIIFLSWD